MAHVLPLFAVRVRERDQPLGDMRCAGRDVPEFLNARHTGFVVEPAEGCTVSCVGGQGTN
jgi:hypothetical protein